MTDKDDLKQYLIKHYLHIRRTTERCCEPLETEDYVIQSMDDVSPPKWHLAHTTWFFETFILAALKSYQHFDAHYSHLFNSYYQSVGAPYPRAQRGLLARPTVKKIFEYRHAIDEQILNFLITASDENILLLKDLFILGLHHEQQHQELLLMDIKHNFSLHPEHPTYQKIAPLAANLCPVNKKFIPMSGDKVHIGYQGNDFCFDNELPLHQQLLSEYAIADHLVSNGDYLQFIHDGGYDNAEWWLADGWECVRKNNWRAPLYWNIDDLTLFTLNGLQQINLDEPVSHISFYEADAYARYKKCRLPTEVEWEHYVKQFAVQHHHDNFLEANIFHPRVATSDGQFFGDVWEWTSSAYSPYPGYKPLAGAVGEYNGKFMSNQFVLRGGSCVTPATHIRASYRNFFQPEKRWQFSGIRLAK